MLTKRYPDEHKILIKIDLNNKYRSLNLKFQKFVDVGKILMVYLQVLRLSGSAVWKKISQVHNTASK